MSEPQIQIEDLCKTYRVLGCLLAGASMLFRAGLRRYASASS